MRDYKQEQQQLTAAKLTERKRAGKMNKANAARLREVYNFVKPFLKQDDFIVDIGARDGWFLLHLIQNGHNKVIGVDICTNAVQWMKDLGLTAIHSDAHNIKDIMDNSCDVIFLTHILEHCPNPIAVIGEIHRMLSINGIVYIEVPIEYVINESEAHFINFKNGHELINLLDINKFEFVKCDPNPTTIREGQNFRCIFKKK